MKNKIAIAEILEEIGTLLELKGDNPFKVRSYQNGARAIKLLEEELGEVIAQGKLRSIPGIGAALAENITLLYKEGHLAYYEELKNSIAPGLLEMLEVSGLGAKRVKTLHEKLGIDTLEALLAACKTGKVALLEGFGQKSQEKILKGIENYQIYLQRHLWWDAWKVAEPILAWLRSLPQVQRAEIAGSLRRKLETVGDIDFIVSSSVPDPIMAAFTTLPSVTEVIACGPTKSSVRFGGLQADLRVVPPEKFFYALHHFTGSKQHNIQMRQLALSRKLSLSEWGLRGNHTEGPILVDEQALFAQFALPYIPPELREGTDEIEMARQGRLPKLVEPEEIKGVFHNHTIESDGSSTLEELLMGAEERGWEYLGIAEHSKSSFQANGLDETRLAKQIEVIKKINLGRKYKPYLFSGIECDILPSGDLDLEESILKELDYVIASVHSAFGQSEEQMTARIIKALEHPCVTMVGHLTGRLLLKREPYAVDVNKVIDAAAANGKIIELNGVVNRLDMDWRHWRRAASKGVLCCINPDAHAVEQLDYYLAGVNIARKGWLSKEEVFNTRSLEKVKKFFGL